MIRSKGKYPLLCHILLMDIESSDFSEVLFNSIDAVSDAGADSEQDTDG